MYPGPITPEPARRACRRALVRRALAFVAVASMVSGVLTATTVTAASASACANACATPASAYATPDSPPDLINDLNLLGSFQPNPALPPEQAPTQQYVATAAQITSLDDLQNQAVTDTLQDHGLATTDQLAAESWGRDDAISELWALLVQAIDTPACTAGQTPGDGCQTVDQQNAAAWLANAVIYQNEQAADDAGLEYAKWAGLGADGLETLFGGSEAAIQTFLSQTPLTYGPDETSLLPDVSGPEGYCNYTPPAPYQSQYTSGLGGGSVSPNCYSDCTSILGCPVPTPTYNDFVTWGTADATSGFDNGSFAGIATDVAEAIGFAGAVSGGSTAGVILSPALAGVLVGTSVADAISPYGGVAGAAIFEEGGVAALEAAQGALAATAVAGVVAIVVAAIANAVIEGINVTAAANLPGQLASLITGASAAPDLASMLQDPNQAQELYDVFIGSTLPNPTVTSCNNDSGYSDGSLPTPGSSLTEDGGVVDDIYPVEPPCLNAPAVPAPSAADAEFTITEKGSSTSTQASSITWADGSSTDTAYVPYSNWWAETATDGASSATFQTLRLDYTDWAGNDQEAWLVENADGSYGFVTTELGAGASTYPCTTLGSCTVSPYIDYVGPDGNDYSASLPAPGAPRLPLAPPSAATQSPTSVDVTASPGEPLAGAPVTFTAEVTNPAATGTVSFVDEDGGVATTLCASANVNQVATSSSSTTYGGFTETNLTLAAEATCTATLASTGSQEVYATYGGDTLDLPAQGILTVDVSDLAPTVTTVTASSPTPTAGQQVTYTAKVAGFYDPMAPLSGTVSFSGDGVACTQSLTVSAAGWTATCTATAPSAGDLTVQATYSGEPAVASASTGSVTVAVEGVVDVDVSGSQGYGDTTPVLSYSGNAPAGVSVTGTLSCTTVDGGTYQLGASVPAGSYTIDGSSCSGLSLSGTGYTINYVGDTYTVEPAPVLVNVSGSQTYGSSSPSFTYNAPANLPDGGVNLPSGVTVTGTVSCATVDGGADSIGPALTANTYAIDSASCSGLSLSDPDYAVTYNGLQFDVTPATITVTASGSETYEAGNIAFTYADDAPSGVTITGGLTCALLTQDGQTFQVSKQLAVGTYTVDASRCSGLEVQSLDYTLAYAAGTFIVSPVPGGTVTLGKTTALIGNYPEKVSGTGWAAHGDTTVTLNECATTTYSAASCDAANQVNVALGTGKLAGTFKSAVIDLATGVIDTDGDTCGVGGSTTCDIVVVGDTADSTSSAALGFTLPAITVKKTTAVLGNYVDAVTASGFPIGDTVVAQECDASVSVPSTTSTHCDAATQISGTAGTRGKVVFSPTGVTLRIGSAYSDTADGTVAAGGSGVIGITDSDNAAIGLSESVGFASPALTLKETAAVIGNYVDVVKAAGFPIGDTVVAQECDPSVVIPTSVASDCDAATQITGTAGAKGAVVFSPTGVKLLVGGAFSDSAGGACSFGGTCEVVVTDSDNPGIGTDGAVTFAVPTLSVTKSSGVAANDVDKVTAKEFPVGDTVTVQECDTNVTSATLGTHCDGDTQISGTVSASGAVAFSPTGVKVLVGDAYSDSAGGTCPAGGSCDIVVNDATTGAYLAVPVGLAS